MKKESQYLLIGIVFVLIIWQFGILDLFSTVELGNPGNFYQSTPQVSTESDCYAGDLLLTDYSEEVIINTDKSTFKFVISNVKGVTYYYSGKTRTCAPNYCGAGLE